MRLIERSLTKTILESLYESSSQNKATKRIARYKKSNRVRMNESDKYYVSFSSGELNMDVPFNNDKIKREVIKGKGGKGPDGVETDLIKYIGTKEDLEKLMDKGFDGEYKNSIKKLEESEEVKEDKKVTKVEVLVLPTIKFMWAEGNQDHIKALFGSAEEHDMDFSKFQNAVYTLDQEVSSSGRGGYDKVKYVANIKVKFTYEDGSTSEETSTYTGRVDCGDGYKYVTVSKNMQHFIQDVYKDAEVTVKEDDTAELKESAANEGITLKDYTMNYFDGDIDEDVTDVEIDMLVAFVYDFNEEPKDNYDRFLNLLGERTKVVKVGKNVLTCDFSSVFKPYEDKLQDFFNMDYSEFNEAWAEAVSNLEALISGNAGEKTYKELIDILTSRQVNESASIDVNNLTKEQLWKLRQEIVLGSLYTSDYNNSFGIDPSAVSSFFDGFIEDAQMDDYGKPNNRKTEEYDNAEDLYNYYKSCENPFGEVDNMNEDAAIDNDPDLDAEQVQADVDYWTDVDEANTEDVSNMKPIGVYTVSNNSAIYVYQIEYDIEDRVLVGDSSDETKAKWRDIIYDDEDAYFWYGDIKIPFNNVVRTDI